MPFNGAGTFTLVAGNPVVTGTTISSTWANNTLSDIANNGLTNCLTKDGQQTPTANIPMGNFRITGLGDAVNLTDAPTVRQVQNGAFSTLSGVTGTDTIAGSATPSIIAYTAGQTFDFIATAANTTNAVTLNVNGLGAKSVTKFGANALAAGDIQNGQSVRVRYDGTQFQMISPTIGGIVGRNRLINGDFVVSQYNGGSATTPTTTAYVIDRWQAPVSQASKLTFQQITAPTGFTSVSTALRISVASAFSPGAGDIFLLRQPVEGLNIRDFQWGTAAAKSVSLQIQVSASLTGTYSLYFANSALNRAYVTTVTVTAANTPQNFPITIPGDTSGSWPISGFLYVGIDLGSGSNFNVASGSWGAGSPTRTSGSVSLVANAGASITISGCQLETGSPTGLEVLNYAAVLAYCQRYYCIVFSSFSGSVTNAVQYSASFSMPIQMRTAPTVLSSTNLTALQFPAAVGTIATNLSGYGTETRSCNATGNGGLFQSNINLQAEL